MNNGYDDDFDNGIGLNYVDIRIVDVRDEGDG